MSTKTRPRLQLAYFSPLSPQRTGIADYNSELLPHLSELADVTLFVDDPGLLLDELVEQYEIRPYSDYPTSHQKFDLPIYHLGNSHFHKNIYETFCQFPGIVVLHDYVLHHFFADQSVWGSNYRYHQEITYNHNSQAIFGTEPRDPFADPLNGRITDLSLGLIAHSQYVIDNIQQQNAQLPTAKIPQLMPVQTGQSRRHDLPFPESAIIFASIGLITTSKQIEFALETFAQLAQTNENIFYLLVGEVLFDVPLVETIANLGLEKRVHCVGYVAGLQNFVDWIVTADVIINLRYPTSGETSATALRAMAAGKPVIMFDHGWYAELPQDACIQVPILDQAALSQAMARLAADVNLRQQMGARALTVIETICHPQQVAQNYIDFINTVLQKYGDF